MFPTLRRFLLALAWCSLLAPGFLAPAWAASPAPSPAGQSPPYQDPSVTGGIGLCSPDHQPITHGKVTDVPFIGYAVSSVPAPAGYVAEGGTAQLLGFQPAQGQDPRTWQGELITAPTTFSDEAHPTAAMTGRDGSLNDFLRDYSPGWGGYIQLRLYLGRTLTGQQPYAAGDILVGVDTWTLVDGAQVPCTAGTAVSAENAPQPSVGPPSPTRSPSPGPGASPAPGSTPVAAQHKGSGSAPATWTFVGLVVLGLLLLVCSRFLPRTRRGRGS